MHRKRQKRSHLVLFEDFSNELLGEIFSYLNGVDALFAFSELNCRFQYLLNQYCRIFDFKSIRKRKFDCVFRNSDTKNWKSLKLSDDNDITSGQIEHFSQYFTHKKQFSQLESLSILGTKIDDIYLILSDLRFLRNLVSLTMKPVCGRRILEFNFPQLRKLVISTCKQIDWLKTFPGLQNLDYTVTYCCYSEIFSRWPLTLKRLRITFENGERPESIHQSFRSLDKLNTLEIYQTKKGKSFPDGQKWKKLIRSSFPSLKNFRFYLQFNCTSFSSDELNEIIASFSTSLYEYKKEWFAHCDLHLHIGDQDTHFYSLRISLKPLTIFKRPFYENLSILLNINNNILKPDIINLIVNTHLNRIKWVPKLTILRHLDIQFGTIMSLKTFSVLLDSIPHLDSLTVEKSVLQILTDNGKHVVICNQLSHKIRCLKLYSISIISWKSNRYELYEILKPFITKCEYLSLNTPLSCETIAFILRIFRQLQSLHVIITREDRSKINKEWLERQTTKLSHLYHFISNNQCHCYFSLGLN